MKAGFGFSLERALLIFVESPGISGFHFSKTSSAYSYDTNSKWTFLLVVLHARINLSSGKCKANSFLICIRSLKLNLLEAIKMCWVVRCGVMFFCEPVCKVWLVCPSALEQLTPDVWVCAWSICSAVFFAVSCISSTSFSVVSSCLAIVCFTKSLTTVNFWSISALNSVSLVCMLLFTQWRLISQNHMAPSFCSKQLGLILANFCAVPMCPSFACMTKNRWISTNQICAIETFSRFLFLVTFTHFSRHKLGTY